MPPFELEGGLLLVLLRAAAVASLLSAFGALVFGVAVLPRAVAGVPAAALWEGLTRLCRGSLVAAFAFAVLWLVAEAGQIADAPGLAASLAAVPAVLAGTVFGHVLALRLLALAGALLVLGRHPGGQRWRGATVVCAGAVGLHAGHSHALAIGHGPSLLLAAQVVHLLAAGAWLGGLLPLLLVVRRAPPRIAAAACRWFSPLGKWCVAGLVLSAFWQFCCLIGGMAALLGTAHGWMDAAKWLLFLVLLGFAALNRYRLAPALRWRDLRCSLAWQTGAGLAIVLVATVLAGLPPGQK